MQFKLSQNHSFQVTSSVPRNREFIKPEWDINMTAQESPLRLVRPQMTESDIWSDVAHEITLHNLSLSKWALKPWDANVNHCLLTHPSFSHVLAGMMCDLLTAIISHPSPIPEERWKIPLRCNFLLIVVGLGLQWGLNKGCSDDVLIRSRVRTMLCIRVSIKSKINTM